MAVGFMIVIPAQAGIQGVRGEDGFRAPARRQSFAGVTDAGVGSFHDCDGPKTQVANLRYRRNIATGANLRYRRNIATGTSSLSGQDRYRGKLATGAKPPRPAILHFNDRS